MCGRLKRWRSIGSPQKAGDPVVPAWQRHLCDGSVSALKREKPQWIFIPKYPLRFFVLRDGLLTI